MKTIVKISMLFAILMSTQAYCQRDTTGWGRNSRFTMMYDSKTVAEISGEITKVEIVSPLQGMSKGIHITVRSGDQDHSVHLGPQWYFDSQSMKLKEKDRVMVKGSKIMVNGSPAIIAMEVTRGTEVLRLRNDNGIPMWSRRGR